MRVRVLNVMEGTVFPSLMGVHHSFFTACERPPPIVENDDDETATAAELNGWTNLETTMPLAIALDEYEANILSLDIFLLVTRHSFATLQFLREQYLMTWKCRRSPFCYIYMHNCITHLIERIPEDSTSPLVFFETVLWADFADRINMHGLTLVAFSSVRVMLQVSSLFKLKRGSMSLQRSALARK